MRPRDAVSEAAFFQTYGNVFSLYIADKREAEEARIAEPRELPYVREALASIGEGGYPEALARVACLLSRRRERQTGRAAELMVAVARRLREAAVGATSQRSLSEAWACAGLGPSRPRSPSHSRHRRGA